MRFRPVPVAHEPIVPAKDGAPPNFVVSCLECGFAHDAHALTAEDAVQAITATHAEGKHKMIASAVDYTKGWTHPGQPLAGIPAREGPHPMYGRP